MSTPQYVRDNIFEQLGLRELSTAQKMAMLEQFNDIVNKRVMIRVLEMLPEEKRDELIEKDSASNDEQMEALVRAVPNILDIIAEEIEVLKNELKVLSLPN